MLGVGFIGILGLCACVDIYTHPLCGAYLLYTGHRPGGGLTARDVSWLRQTLHLHDQKPRRRHEHGIDIIIPNGGSFFISVDPNIVSYCLGFIHGSSCKILIEVGDKVTSPSPTSVDVVVPVTTNKVKIVTLILAKPFIEHKLIGMEPLHTPWTPLGA